MLEDALGEHGIPLPSIIAENYEDADGAFDSDAWTISIHPKFLNADTLSNEDLGELVNTAVREFVHAKQYYMVARRMVDVLSTDSDASSQPNLYTRTCRSKCAYKLLQNMTPMLRAVDMGMSLYDSQTRAENDEKLNKQNRTLKMQIQSEHAMRKTKSI